MKTLLKIICCICVSCILTGCPICATGSVNFTMVVNSQDTISVEAPPFYSGVGNSFYTITTDNHCEGTDYPIPLIVSGEGIVMGHMFYSKNCGKKDEMEQYVYTKHVVKIKRLSHNAPIKIVHTNQSINGYAAQEGWFDGDKVDRDSVFTAMVQHCGEENLVVIPTEVDEIDIVVYTPYE